MIPYGETTTPGSRPEGVGVVQAGTALALRAIDVEQGNGSMTMSASDLEVGLLVGLLVGEGHFGGDGRQPHVTLRMHIRHEALFRWLQRTYPGGRLYGPYNHGGREYFQWMARGPFLRDVLMPLLEDHLSPELDRHSHDRFEAMKARYQRELNRPALEES